MSKTIKISYQGAPGAYSDLICQLTYPDAMRVPCATFKQAIAAVQDGSVDYAMIPIDNSLAGRVVDVYHLLPESGLSIVGGHYLPIHHCLMANKGAKLDQITDVFSHIHALPQCQKFIQDHGLKPIVYGDTAASAEYVAEMKNPHFAAIASKAAADLYGLDILAENIEDHAKNTTRFIVLSKTAETPEYVDGESYTTSLLFTVRSLPAVLYKCLGGFATNGINLSKIESYMIDGDFEKTRFYCDVSAHTQDPRMAYALEELAFYTDAIQSFGTYKDNRA